LINGGLNRSELYRAVEVLHFCGESFPILAEFLLERARALFLGLKLSLQRSNSLAEILGLPLLLVFNQL
jgi:hypothetical protein